MIRYQDAHLVIDVLTGIHDVLRKHVRGYGADVLANDLASRILQLIAAAQSLTTYDEIQRFRDGVVLLSRDAAYLNLKHLPVPYPGAPRGIAAFTDELKGVVPVTVGHSTIEGFINFIRLASDQWAAEAVRSERLRPTPPRHLVPAEKIAPFHFDLLDDRLSVVSEPASVSSNSAISAKAALIEQGKRLLLALETSNSPQLRAAFEAVQSRLASDQDIVQLGIFNLTCEEVVKANADEISAVLERSLQAHALGVRHYLAQFPEWVSFSDSAAELELSRQDVDDLAQAIKQVATEFENQAFIDDEVPRTLRFLTDLRADPMQTVRRKGLALIRTLENIAISVFRRTTAFGSATINRSLDGATNLVGDTLGKVLAFCILQHLASLAGMSGAAWLISAAAIMLNRADDLREK